MRYIQCLNRHGFRFAYQTFHLPVWRAVTPEEKFNVKKYSLNSIRSWPLFQLTTFDYSLAMSKAYRMQGEEDFKGDLVVFKIFLSEQNAPSSHILLSGTEFTHYKSE